MNIICRRLQQSHCAQTSALKILPFASSRGFLRAAARHPERTAVVEADGKAFTYGDLLRESAPPMDIMEQLQSAALEGTAVAAVVMEKSFGQLASCMRALRMGMAYLPIASSWPAERRDYVIGASGAAFVMDADGIRCAHSIADGSATIFEEDMGYLIYTSGSTGKPKGVKCTHLGAVNTICDLVDELELGGDDAVLALSSMSFDLSVFDLFATTMFGGRIVLPPKEPDPAEWLSLMRSNGVTLVNCVPAFVELMVTHLEQVCERLPSSLRVIMMSGDWIPLSLPGRIYALSENASLRVMSLGGATEAAIWSNAFEIEKEWSSPERGWSSIPTDGHCEARPCTCLMMQRWIMPEYG